MLALQFGYPNVQKLKDEISPGQFYEWKQFYAIRPFGDEFMDNRFAFQTGNIVSMLAKVDNWGDFRTPIYAREHVTRYQSPQEQTAILDALVKGSKRG